MMICTHSLSTRKGGEQSRHWAPVKWFGWFWRVTDQDWSPAMTERRRAIGVIICGVRFCAETERKIWRDGRP